MTGELVKVFPGKFHRVTSCKNQLYFTTDVKTVAVWDTNGKEILALVFQFIILEES